MNKQTAFAPAPTVNGETVPRCLRYSGYWELFAASRDLAYFLQLAMEGMLRVADEDGSPREHDSLVFGMSRCFELLRDLLDIGCGEIKFPPSSLLVTKDKPSLWEGLRDMEKGKETGNA